MVFNIDSHLPLEERKITQKIHEIAITLKKHQMPLRNAYGLLGGKIGIALFFVHYARFTNSSSDKEFAYQLIYGVVEDYYQGPNKFLYSTGFAGLGWFLQHINLIEFAEVDAQDVLGDFDGFFCQKMSNEMDSYNYDFLHGGLGISYYLMNRDNSSSIDVSLTSIIDRLDEIAVRNGDKISWLSFDPKTKSPKSGEFNLGLAHGNPGILSVLCSMYHKKPFLREKLIHLIEKNTNFILWCFANRPLADHYSSSFSFAYNEKEPFVNSRLGWCYGDLGVALSLRSANTILKNASVDLVIRQILERSVQRKSILDTKLFDAGLCHGTVGVAHIYNSFYQEFKLPYLKQAADHWYLESLSQANFPHAPAGYKAYRQNSDSIDSYGFLEGIAGIGLGYISYLNNDSSWDRSLLITI